VPARFNSVKRALAKFGVTVLPGKGTSHYRAIDASGKTYPIPAHNGLKTELTDVYIKGVCRCFNIDYESFRKAL
jgi:hypothetical protein